MLTVSGCVGVPTTATMSPIPLRMSGASSRIRPRTSGSAFGVIFTRSAPAPLSVMLSVMVSALVPGAPVPSTYSPLQMTTVSPSLAAFTAACTDVYEAAGQSALSSSTVSVAAYAPCAQHKTPALTSAGSNRYLKPLGPLKFACAEQRTLSDIPDNVGKARRPWDFAVDLSQRAEAASYVWGAPSRVQ